MGFLGNATTQTDFFEDKQSELAYYGSESNAVENEISLEKISHNPTRSLA